MAKIGVGFVGCGGMGASLAKGLSELDTAEAVACFDEVSDAAAKFAETSGARACGSFDELLADDAIQAVVVASPQFAHAENTIAAAKAGKHVFCEKPMAVTLEQCDAMIAACREAGVKLMIGQVCRYHAVHGKVKELVDSGEFGKPVCMIVRRIGGSWGGAYDQHWRLKREMSGGNLMEIHAHEIDFMRWVCGDVVKVYAAGGIFVDKRLDYPDLALVTMHFANGAKGLLHSGQVSAIGGYGGRVDCEGGSIYFPAIWGADGGIHVCKTGGEKSFIPAGDLKVQTPVAHELADFLEGVATGTDVPVPGKEGRGAVEIALAAYKSIDTGQVVDLPL